MNRRLEIALCELLPHKVKCLPNEGGGESTLIRIDVSDELYLLSGETWDEEFYIEEFKPHLRSLSQLTKPIVVEGYNDGNEFVPMKELNRKMVSWICHEYGSVCFYLPHTSSTINILSEPHEVINLLKQWHFNVWGLTKDEYIEIE